MERMSIGRSRRPYLNGSHAAPPNDAEPVMGRASCGPVGVARGTMRPERAYFVVSTPASLMTLAHFTASASMKL